MPARDHQRYDHDTMLSLQMSVGKLITNRECDALLVTGKDWVKLQNLVDWSAWHMPIVVPQLAIEIVEGEHELRERVLAAARRPVAGNRAR